MLSRRKALVGLLGSVGVLTACSMPAPATPTPTTALSAAQQERQLVLSMQAGADVEAFAGRLQGALPGLDLRLSELSPSKVGPQILAEQQNGQFNWDLHLGPTSNMVSVLGPAGALDRIDPYLDSLPADEIAPDKWAGGFKLYTDPNNPTTLVTYFGLAGGMWVNRARAPRDRLASVDQVVDPAWKGQIVIYDPTVVNGGSQTLATLYLLKGEEFVRKILIDQQPVIAGNQADVANWLSQGRYAIGDYVQPVDLKQLTQQGLARDLDVLPNTRYVQTNGVSVFRNPPHPDVVKAVLSWVLGHEGQDAFASIVANASTRRTDVTVYNPDDAADPTKLSTYGFIAGLSTGQEAVARVNALAKGT
jgi:ABC-type Fe3+ transport system substrate-binding protein